MSPMTPEACPVCGEDVVVKLSADWQALVGEGAAIPIVGCGNPWHYATSTLADPPLAAMDLIAEGIEAFRVTREYVDPKGGDPTSTDGLLPALPGWAWFDWCEKARRAKPSGVADRLRETIGTGDSSSGLPHWHTVTDTPDGEPRHSVYVERQAVLDEIDRILGK